MLKFADRVQERTTTTGAGNLTLEGAVAGFHTFAAKLSVGDTFSYAIQNQAIPTEFEYGTGTLVNATTISRDTVAGGSNGASAVVFSAGTKHIGLAGQAKDFAHVASSNTFTAAQDLGGNKITNLADPTATQDAATKAYADSAVVTDHGALTGLGDNDHPQYALLAAANTYATGPQTITGSPGFTRLTVKSSTSSAATYVTSTADFSIFGLNDPGDGSAKTSNFVADARITLSAASNSSLIGFATGNANATSSTKLTIDKDGNVLVNGFTSTTIGLTVKAAASQSANLQEWQSSTGGVHATVSENGYMTTRKNAAPADGELVAGEAAYWFDATNGAAAFNIKGKTLDGTVVTGSVALA